MALNSALRGCCFHAHRLCVTDVSHAAMLVCSSGWLYRGLSLLGSFQRAVYIFSFSVLWSFVLKHHWFLFLSCCLTVPFSPLAVAAWFDFSLRGVWGMRTLVWAEALLRVGRRSSLMVSLGPFVPDCKLQVACGLPLSPDVDSEEQGPRPPGSVCISLASL